MNVASKAVMRRRKSRRRGDEEKEEEARPRGKGGSSSETRRRKRERRETRRGRGKWHGEGGKQRTEGGGDTMTTGAPHDEQSRLALLFSFK